MWTDSSVEASSIAPTGNGCPFEPVSRLANGLRFAHPYAHIAPGSTRQHASLRPRLVLALRSSPTGAAATLTPLADGHGAEGAGSEGMPPLPSREWPFDIGESHCVRRWARSHTWTPSRASSATSSLRMWSNRRLVCPCARGQRPRLGRLIFLPCHVRSFLLRVLLFHPLVRLPPHVLEVFGFRDTRFFSASPSQPLWFSHDLSPPLATWSRLPLG